MTDRLALLIGNTKFDAPENFPKLRTPANDVQDFARCLSRHGKFQIIDKLINKNVEVLKQAIEDFYINRAKRGELTLLYYSGHGFRDKDGKFYLATKNTQFRRPWTIGIEDDFIRQVIHNSSCKHNVIVLDCCHSGAFIEGRKSGTEPLLFEKLEGITTAILASSRAAEYSFESKGRNSLFTYHLINGIKTGKADKDNDGRVSVQELFDYAELKVRNLYKTQSPIMNLITSKSKVTVSWCPQLPEEIEPLWFLPTVDEILEANDVTVDKTKLNHQKAVIEFTLEQRGIEVNIQEIYQGPRTTQFSIKTGNATRIRKIKKNSDALTNALNGIRVKVEEPTQSYPFIRIVVPNETNPIVKLRSVVESSSFRQPKGVLKIGLGLDTFGESIAVDLTTMPHLLIGGTTGSGKSVCIDAIIASLLCTQTPDDLRFILLDSTFTGLSKYNGIPHLYISTINHVEEAVEVLERINLVISERRTKFDELETNNISSYNQKIIQDGNKKLPYIVVIIDGLTDYVPVPLIDSIVRTGHPSGIHLILTANTNVVPRYIKKNIPTRIAFAITSEADSREILDIPDAAYLQGMGDMHYKASNSPHTQRVQGAYVSDTELERIIRFWKNFNQVDG